MKHFTIPVFVPELACPNRCIFCNQHSISGCHELPDPDKTVLMIESRLGTIPEASHIEVGFFGGNFTGIESELQHSYLSIAHKYLQTGKINAIRISTRPDYITPDSLKLLKLYNVTTIELGAQSLHDDVLLRSGRGHTVADIIKASKLIRDNGFDLGLQMMTGLPGDSPDKALATAKMIVELGASCTRIYPTLVIRNTELAKEWQQGLYQPQSLEEAVTLTASLLSIFKKGGVKVIRVGLHPSEDLINGDDLLAGPFHVSFKQLAETVLWREDAGLNCDPIVENDKITIENNTITLRVPESEMNDAVGYNGSTRKILEQRFSKVTYLIEEKEHDGLPLIIADKRTPLPVKNSLNQIGRVSLLDAVQGVYKSISGHPDIFICQGIEETVIAPNLPDEIISKLLLSGKKVIKGRNNPGKKYPLSACYNAVVTEKYLIHNLKITDPEVLETFKHKKHIHVNQGYTRCNLLALDNNFITSDRGIENRLLAEGCNVLYVDPSPIILKGQKHGFFPGCCGIYGKEVLITGSLKFHPQEHVIRDFISLSGYKTRELFNGQLTDVGSILVF